MSDKIPAKIRLKVVTPNRLLVETEVESVSIPSLEGDIGVLPGHRPLVVGVGKGRVEFHGAGGSDYFVVKGGFARVEPDSVVVMTEASEDEDAGNPQE